MEKSVEMEARTLEEATTNALRTLGANREEVEIKVLDDGKTGFLGFGSRLAKIRVTMKGAGKNVIQSVGDPLVEVRTEPPLEKQPTVPSESPMKEIKEKAEVDLELAQEILSGLIDRMKMEGMIESRIRDERVHMNVVGKDSGILIGKGGQTLDAIQYLVNLMYSKTTKSRAGIIVDIEEYKIRREKKLQAIALEARNKVIKSQKPFSTAPLSSQDRRIIHITLQNDEEVKTVSRGDGVLKKVIVLPK
ncbi:MAG: KH domain-containing protein [Deltaproteobacteria bacterium]|nr:KH domain-containing protein [Deltaproteobacteria bacterium]